MNDCSETAGTYDSYDYSEDIMRKNCTKMNFPLNFKLMSFQNSRPMIYALKENHEKLFAELNQFKFNDRGRYENDQTKAILTQLVSCIKKIRSTLRKCSGVFEGMYGFVSSHYYFLFDGLKTGYNTYHWQYLKSQHNNIKMKDEDNK